MLYLSKGAVLSPSTKEELHISHCGVIRDLIGVQATLWLNGRFGFSSTNTFQEQSGLQQLADAGLVELSTDDTPVERYRILSCCVICPAKTKLGRGLLHGKERTIWRWLTHAAIRLTLPELVYLSDHGIMPCADLLGIPNRQALVETIYTTDNILDGVLEAEMEHAGTRDETVQSIMSLLKKKRLLLI